MPIVLLAPFGILLVGLWLLAMQQSNAEWLRSLISSLTIGSRPRNASKLKLALISPILLLDLPWRALEAGVKKVLAAILAGAQKIIAASAVILGHIAGARLAALTQFLEGLEWLVTRAANAISGLAEDTAEALAGLRTAWIPRYVAAIVRPIREVAIDARDLARATASTVEGASAQFRAQLQRAGFGTFATLGNALVGLTIVTDNLHRHVWQNVWPRVQHVTSTMIPALEARVAAIEDTIAGGLDTGIGALRDRVKALEDAIAGIGSDVNAFLRSIASPAAFATAAVAAVTAFAPNLFCRNSRRATETLCGLDDDMFEALLMGTLAFAVALNPREVAEAAQGVAGAIDGVIRETAGL